jgi:multiple sugar transport system substrate-binding protein
VPWDNWYQTFTTAIGSGTAPDISTGAAYQAVDFYDQGAVQDLDDVVEKWEKDGKLADFYPGAVDVLKYNGHYVALPWAIDIRILHYRKDLFDDAGIRPPTNWEELRDAAQELTGGGQYGMVSASDTGGTHYLYTFMLNNGGGIFTEDRKPNMMSDRNVEALEFFSELAKNEWIHPDSAGFTGDDALRVFSQGDAAMIIDNPGLPAQFPDLENVIGQTQPLEGPHGDKGTIYWINNVMLYEQSEYPDEARTFLRWWSENQKPLWTKGHSTQLPARESFAEEQYFRNQEALTFIIENWVPVGETTATKSEGIFPELNEVEGEGVMFTLVQDLLQGKDPGSLLPGVQADLKEIMSE